MKMKERLQGSFQALQPARESMTLTPGTQFGTYEILSSLGAGGMGEVYRARDSSLGREVAIKVLRGQISPTKDRLDRFKREARSASALNHPNIVTIYELGQVSSTHYIAMELVVGKTLRELTASGSIPMRKIIQIAAQVADGLSKAHEAGIIHRDLKPENLMVSQDGFVKILDFGLSKLAPRGEECSELTTISDSQTQSGAILGTLEYMSPEQASGRSLDFRSDQFSFGVVLYEMVTGKRAFRKSTGAGTLLAIVQENPEPIASLNSEAPAPLSWVVERCLAKEPEKRYASTRDLVQDIAAIRDRFGQLQAKSVETQPCNLPVQRTAFVGRDKELAAAKELLLRDDVRLLTVTGPAGIGKTRLALEVAREMLEHFSAGVYFIPLAAVGDPALIPAIISQALNIRETGGQAPLEALREYLQNSLRTPTLLLLDNFEHLIAAAPTVSDLLAIGANLKVLVTSRAALHVYGEHEFPVSPLALPDSRSLPPLKELSQYSAVTLFIKRAKAVKPDFEISADNAAAVAEICARLDGLPLAIEIAAARVKLFSPSAMRKRLASRLELLTGGPRDLPARQQTLRGAIDWSYDLLTAAEQKLFRRLSVFAGPCTLEAVEAVCNTKNDLGLNLLDGVASMVDRSLMQQAEQAESESRFVMLETIREYGLEKLAASGEEPLTRRAHAAFFLVLAEEGASERAGAEQSESLDRFEIEHNNFRAALDWLTENGDAEWGLRLGAALFRFWETREYLAEGRDRLGKLLNLGGAMAPTKARARVLFAAGVMAGGQGDYGSSDALLQESLEIARRLNDKRAIAVSLNALAVIARDRGDAAASRSLFEESLALWREFDDSRAVARSLSNLANVVKLQGDYTHARSLYEECLSIFRELDDRVGIAWSLNYEGDVARDQGDATAARSLYEQSLVMFRELGDRWGTAGSLADLGNLALDQKNCSLAGSLYRESLRIFKELDHKRGIARLLECCACAAAVQFEPQRSLRLAGAAAALRQTIGAPPTPVEQIKLEASLEQARQALTSADGASAWLEGWAMPFEKAIETALTSDSTSSASEHA
jgi:predicted ATPase/serine/threonine protein kinase